MTYISYDDMRNKTFNKFSEVTRSGYLDIANEQVEDLAEALGIMDPSVSGTLIIPPHHTVKEYAINYCLSVFSADYIGINEVTVGENDKYQDMFERSQYLINQLKPRVTKEMLTGDVDEQSDRSVSFGRTWRG